MRMRLRSAFAIALAAADCASPPPSGPTAPPPAPSPTSLPVATVEPATDAEAAPPPPPQDSPQPVPPAVVKLPEAPAKLEKQIPYFGWLPPIADCAMWLEGEVGPIKIPTPRGPITRPHPDPHPARVTKALGKCDATTQKAQVAKLKADQEWVKFVFFSNGNELALADVKKSLLPIDTAEKAALHLILSSESLRWYAGPKDEWISSEDQRLPTAKCFGCKMLETKATPEGYAFLTMQSETLERAGCHQKIGIFRTMVVVAPDGKTKPVARTQMGMESPFCVGRAPEGYVARAPATESEAAYFASLARDEAASIGSFERLARELRAHGAPVDLVQRAERAADDERRHARMMATLAGMSAEDVDVYAPPMDVRPLADVARENAVEGCVRETYAALVTLDHANRADSSRVRAIMGRVADDEIEHAELAFDVDAWARGRLPETTIRAIDAAREAAIAELGAHAHARRESPSSRALISTLRRLVWA